MAGQLRAVPRSAQAPAYAALAALALLASILAQQAGLSFGGFAQPLLSILLMAAIAAIYRRRQPTMQIADMASYAILWLGFLPVAAILTYVAARHGQALADARLAAFDAGLGFDWMAWRHFVDRHPLLGQAFALVYPTIFPQVAFALVFFSVTRRPERNDELWWSVLLTLLLTCIGSALLPALGAGVGANGAGPAAVHLPHLLALRDGSIQHVALVDMQGIISMPSYHTVLALLIPIVFRGYRTLFWLLLALNVFMLFSLPTQGNHYLADILAGILLTLPCSFLVQRWLGRRRHGASWPAASD
jgi:hypothetical protein